MLVQNDPKQKELAFLFNLANWIMPCVGIPSLILAMVSPYFALIFVFLIWFFAAMIAIVLFKK